MSLLPFTQKANAALVRRFGLPATFDSLTIRAPLLPYRAESSPGYPPESSLGRNRRALPPEVRRVHSRQPPRAIRQPASLRLVIRKRSLPDATGPYFRVSLKHSSKRQNQANFAWLRRQIWCIVWASPSPNESTVDEYDPSPPRS